MTHRPVLFIVGVTLIFMRTALSQEFKSPFQPLTGEKDNLVVKREHPKANLAAKLPQALLLKMEPEVIKIEKLVSYEIFGRFSDFSSIKNPEDIWLAYEDAEHLIWPQRNGNLTKDCIFQGNDFFCVSRVGFLSTYPLAAYFIRVAPGVSDYLTAEFSAKRAVHILANDSRLLGRFKQICGPFAIDTNLISCAEE